MEDPSDEKNSLESHLECQICLSLVCEPVTIPCGHTFCRSCLVQSLRRSKKQCVTCRSICNVDPIEASENIMIKNIAQLSNPSLYQTRLHELEIERLNWSAILPVFFYNAVMFPGEILSLHLFEPRYKLMMQRISSNSRKFAYVYVSPHRPLIGSVALVAHVREAEFFSDGRCLVEAILTAPRYTIQETYEESGTQGLYLAHLTPLNDLSWCDSNLEDSQVPSKFEICKKVSQCREICSYLQQSSSLRAYDPLPATPSPEIENSHFLTAIETLTLFLMGRITTRCPGEKVQYLYSQNSLERLEFCLHYLLSAIQNHESTGFGGLLRQSMDGFYEWMFQGGVVTSLTTDDPEVTHEDDEDRELR